MITTSVVQVDLINECASITTVERNKEIVKWRESNTTCDAEQGHGGTSGRLAWLARRPEAVGGAGASPAAAGRHISHTRARLFAARRPTDARLLPAEPSTYKPQDMPPPAGCPDNDIFTHRITDTHIQTSSKSTTDRTQCATRSTKARCVSSTRNKASKAHPHIFTFT
ncbi:unnamed protein product [Pieris macdunnoughi]|uniref:Uncharacterized protein n=1 Tax=Pieris macdunnoughi TaxID=345717 RepID=A0A821QPS2_9NEOP|nr:unnamed protein product [Pieris macdunnoughi]